MENNSDPVEGDKGGCLCFKELTLDTIAEVRPYLPLSGSRSCDFSVGGIYMWIDKFKYHYCIYRDTLFIKGVMEDNVSRTAFSLPMGRLPLAESVGLLGDYCKACGLRLEFSAIPAERLDEFRALGPKAVSELRHWADYVYDAEEMASFRGKKMAKKRNHVNKFSSLYPSSRSEEVNASNVDQVKACFRTICEAEPASGSMADYERRQVWHVLDHLDAYGFESLCLWADGRVVAFTFGEVIGDTLHDHIEKMLYSVPGSGETVYHRFAAAMRAKYPAIAYINREDDAGDEGLRRSKLSYNPVMMVDKYNVIF